MNRIIADRRSLREKLSDLSWGGPGYPDYAGEMTTTKGIAQTQISGNPAAGIPNPASTAIEGDGVYYSAVDGAYFRYFVYDWSIIGVNNSQPVFNLLLGPWTAVTGSFFSQGIGAIVNDPAFPSSIQITTGTTGLSFAGFTLGSTTTATFASVRRVRALAKLNQITNSRMWIALQNQGGNAFLTSDNPNEVICGFRYSAVTDTNWQAYCATSNVNFTTINTGFPADTSLHAFDFVIFPNASKVLFYIDQNLVATITTNIAPTNTIANPMMFLDNKASGVAVSWRFFSMRGSMPRQVR